MKQYQEDHKYEQNLRKQGYNLVLIFSDNPNNCEQGFQIPKNYSGWKWRKAIKLYLRNHPLLLKNREYKIIKGIGYWHDLHNIVYEVWMREFINVQ